jgi:hypothetical protein
MAEHPESEDEQCMSRAEMLTNRVGTEVCELSSEITRVIPTNEALSLSKVPDLPSSYSSQEANATFV